MGSLWRFEEAATEALLGTLGSVSNNDDFGSDDGYIGIK